MTKETALRRLEWRTEQLAWLVRTGAPEILIEKQREMVKAARAWAGSPPASIPD